MSKMIGNVALAALVLREDLAFEWYFFAARTGSEPVLPL
jgi:hypothetical protein